MGSFIIKAIQAFSKTERAQRFKAAIKAYQGYGETQSVPLWWQREIDDLPTPEETEAFFDNLDFAMLDQGGTRLGNTFAKFNQ